MVSVRRMNLSDIDSLLPFVITLGLESEYLLYDPGERVLNEELARNSLLKIHNDSKSVIFVALDIDNNVVGYICGEVSNLNRISHVMSANIGVLKKQHGLGVGRLLSNLLIEHARNVGISRIEATVIRPNKMSLNLCKKFGFEIEGIKRRSIKIGDSFHDEYFLSKLI